MKRSLLTLSGSIVSVVASALVGGQVTTDARFSAVGNLAFDGEPGCTATVISSKWIVTAAHCLGGAEDGTPLDMKTVDFRLGNDASKPVWKAKVKRLVDDIGTGGPDSPTSDMAFIELATPVPLEKLKIQPAGIAAGASAVSRAKRVEVIGYGHTKFGTGKNKTMKQVAALAITPAKKNILTELFKTKADAVAYLEAYHADELAYSYQEADAVVDGSALIAGYEIHAWDENGRTDRKNIRKPKGGWVDTCHGDSGGPLFGEVDGKMRILGTVSHGLNRTCATMGTVFASFGPKVLERLKALGIAADVLEDTSTDQATGKH